MSALLKNLFQNFLGVFKKKKYNNILDDSIEIFFTNKNQLCINSNNSTNIIIPSYQSTSILNDLILEKKNKSSTKDYSIDNESICLCDICIKNSEN